MSSELIDDIIELAIVAGHRILEIYNTDFGVEQKSDNTPLTAADMAAHHIIIEGLGRLTPDIPVLSEESATIPFEKRSRWQRYWLVDPLDGTREFVKRNGEFTVNIALIDNHESVLGVVYAPVTGVTYYAARGMGAFKKTPGNISNNGSKTIAIHTRRKTTGNTVIASSRSHCGGSLETFLQKVSDYEIISMGSSLKSCLVAEGHADIYPRLGPTSEWDTAAAQCVVEEAGGRITKTDMQPLRYNTKDELLNPYFLVIGDPDFDWAQYL